MVVRGESLASARYGLLFQRPTANPQSLTKERRRNGTQPSRLGKLNIAVVAGILLVLALVVVLAGSGNDKGSSPDRWHRPRFFQSPRPGLLPAWSGFARRPDASRGGMSGPT